MAKFDGLAVSLETRRRSVAEDSKNAAALHKVVITVEVSGVGELVTDVNFPVVFTEEPTPSSGCVYAGTDGVLPAAEYTAGSVPIGLSSVIAWTKDKTNTLYIGATIAVVTQGAADDNFEVKAIFEGVATRRSGGS